MSEQNIFDVLSTDIEKLDETTLLEDTGINYENVRNRVMSEIHTQRPGRRFKKKVIISFIAATLAITALSVTAVATGTFDRVFGEIISGDCVDGFYSGGNVSVTSSDKDYKMEVLGVAGDDYNAYIALKITKADGTAFKAATDRETDVFFENFEYSVSEPLFSSGGGVSYSDIGYIQEDGSIFYYMIVNRNTFVKGQKFAGHMENLQIVNYEYLDRYCTVGDYDNIEKVFQSISKEYDLKDNQTLYITPDKGQVYIATVEDCIDVEFDVSLDLNYRSTVQKLKVTNDKLVDNFKEIIVSNFNLTIKYSDSADGNQLDYLTEPISGVIALKNGDTLYAVLTSRDIINGSEVTLNFVYSESSEYKKQTSIVPSEVESIIINNIKFIPE